MGIRFFHVQIERTKTLSRTLETSTQLRERMNTSKIHPSSPSLKIDHPNTAENDDSFSDENDMSYDYSPTCLETAKSLKLFVIFTSLFSSLCLIVTTIVWASANLVSTDRLSHELRVRSADSVVSFLENKMQFVDHANSVVSQVVTSNLDILTNYSSMKESKELARNILLGSARVVKGQRVQVGLYLFDQKEVQENYPLDDPSLHLRMISYTAVEGEMRGQESIHWPPITLPYKQYVYNITNIITGESSGITNIFNFSGVQSRMFQTANATFRAGKNSGWTDLYLDTRYCSTEKEGFRCPSRIANVQLLLSPENNLRGYSSMIYTADNFKLFLQRFTIGRGTSFIIERHTGRIIGSSDTNRLEGVSKNIQANPPDAQASPNKLIRRTVRELRKKYDHNLGGIPLSSSVASKLMFKGGKYLYVAQGVNIFDDKYWIVISVVHSWAQLGTVYILFIISIIFSACSVVMGIVTSIITARTISKPLYNLISDMKLVEDMKLEQILKNKRKSSTFSEVSLIQEFFRGMIETLVEYRSFLPEHVLQKKKNLEPEKPNFRMSGVTPSDHSTKSNSQSSFVKSSKSSGKNYIDDSRFALAIESKKVTILHIEIREFYSQLMFNHNYYEIVEIHGVLLQKVTEIADANRGQLFSFNENSFSIIWNGTIRTSNHSSLACKAALSLKSFMKESYVRLKPLEGYNVKLSIGISTGHTVLGNMGTAKRRQQLAFGNNLELARICSKMSKHIPVVIVCSDETVKSLPKDKFLMRSVALMEAPCFGINQQRLHELIEEAPTPVDGEWMYAMEAQKESDRYLQYEEAFALMSNDDICSALDLFRQFQQKQERESRIDMITEKMIEMCEHQLRSKKPKRIVFTWSHISTSDQVIFER